MAFLRAEGFRCLVRAPEWTSSEIPLQPYLALQFIFFSFHLAL